MNINDYIDYMQELLNIKSGNALVALDIREELLSMAALGESVPAEFRTYVKENLNSVELAYMTGLQKFFTLARKFKEQKTARYRHGIEHKAYELSKKVALTFGRALREVLLDQKFKFAFVQKRGGGGHFTEKELFVLERMDAREIHGRLDDAYLLEQLFVEAYQKGADEVIAKKLSAPTVPAENKANIKRVADMAKRAMKVA